MAGSPEASQKALRTTLQLLAQQEQGAPLPEILTTALEALIRQSGSRFAFLLHNHSGTLISEF